MKRKRMTFRDYPVEIGQIVVDHETGEWYRVEKFIESWDYQGEHMNYVYECIRDEEVARMQGEAEEYERRKREFTEKWIEIAEKPVLDIEFDEKKFEVALEFEGDRIWKHRTENDVWALERHSSDFGVTITVRGGQKVQKDMPDPEDTFAMLFG